jgi:hypothetical protein
MDHYRCDLYFIPETRAYRISGSTELFPQHCQLPNLSPHQHLRALTDELAESTEIARATPYGQRLIKLLQANIKKILNPSMSLEDQRVRDGELREQQQRVINETPLVTVPVMTQITDAPPILQAQNPMAKRALRVAPHLHQRVTRNNTPGTVPAINRTLTGTPAPTRRMLPRMNATAIATPTTTMAMPSRRQICLFTQQAINVLTIRELATADTIFTPRALLPFTGKQNTPFFEHYASPMVHPVTGKMISSYKKLMNDPATAEIWQTAFGKDFGGMAQGCNKTGQKGTNAMFVMTRNEIAHALAAGTKFTYANPVFDYRPHKEDPNKIRITAGGNLIQCDLELSVPTADINTAKLHWNSVVSTEKAKYMCLDIKKFYLTAALEYFEYMRIPLSYFPAWMVEQYNLIERAYNGYVYIKMQRAVWGLPQAGILANKHLRRKLAPFGYTECVNTPGLWKHETQPISFTLVINNVGVKYVSKNNVDHLIASIEMTYTLTEDWTGNLYCGITLEWDYVNQHINISMPNYIKRKLQEYGHIIPTRLHSCPYHPEPRKFGTETQAPLPPNATHPHDAVHIKRVQKNVGSILYYAWAVDMTVLLGLSLIAVEQTKATEGTMGQCINLLNYLATNQDAKVRFHASDMVMNIHSDPSYLSETTVYSRACGHFFMEWMPKNEEPIQLNGAFYVNTIILCFVMASAAEAELGALFHNCQEGIIFGQTLINLGHPQS